MAGSTSRFFSVCAGHMPQPRELHVIGHDAVADELVKSDRQGHEQRAPWHRTEGRQRVCRQLAPLAAVKAGFHAEPRNHLHQPILSSSCLLVVGFNTIGVEQILPGHLHLPAAVGMEYKDHQDSLVRFGDQ